MFIDQLYHSKSFSCLVSNTTRTSHAYDMSKIETVEAVQQEQVVSCKLDIKRIVWIYALPLMSQRKQTSCLTTAFFKNSTSLCV